MIPYSPATLLLLAEASGQAEKSFWTDPAVWRPLNLLIFLAIMTYLLVKKMRVGDAFNRRAGGIRKELEEARTAKDEAERKLAEVQGRLNKLDAEVEEIKKEAERESARELERILKVAAADAEKIGQTAQREIEGAVKAAKSDLRAFVAEQSTQMAETIIRREMKTEDNSRLVGKYIDELGGARQ